MIILADMALSQSIFVAVIQGLVYTRLICEVLVAIWFMIRTPVWVNRGIAQEHGTVRAEKEMAARAEYAKRQAWLAQKRDALETRARTLRAAMEVEGLKWDPIQPPRMVSAAPPARAGL